MQSTSAANARAHRPFGRRRELSIMLYVIALNIIWFLFLYIIMSHYNSISKSVSFVLTEYYANLMERIL